MCRVNLNHELNGIELSFEVKPETAILDSIKSMGFRWNRKKSVWYAKQTEERLVFAESLGTIKEETKKDKEVNMINLEGLGENCPESFWMNSGLAKGIREQLKSRGVKGVTVRQGSSGYTPSITVTVKVTADDMASIEEGCRRVNMTDFVNRLSRDLWMNGKKVTLDDYNAMSEEERNDLIKEYVSYEIKRIDSYSGRWSNRNYYFEFSTTLYNKLCAIWSIANQWNYDNSDSMSDYFDVGYYLDIDIKKADDFEPRESMTDEERTSFEEEKRREEEERRIELERYEKEKKEREEECKRYNEWMAKAVDGIYNDIYINDLEEEEQIYITNLAGGIGKECNRKELEESLTDRRTDAVIDRLIIFNSEQAFEDFNELYLADFDFLIGKGGTGSYDVRLAGVEVYALNEEQRNSVKFFSCHCVGIMFKDELKLVIDPQGYNYARYVYIPTDESTQSPAKETLKQQEKESESKAPFHFPDKLAVVVENLELNMPITIYQCDGWILNSIYAGSGIVTGWRVGDYAQYKGLYIDIQNGKKTKSVFIRESKECLVYRGIMPSLPKEITCEKVSDNMYELYNYDRLIPNTYNYYKAQGIEPIIDTCYR